jgi:pimeloyl-ACP methyl ester carboxylesterase
MSVFTDHLSSADRPHQFRTLTPDLRGYGKSQTRQAFEMEDHLTDLEALVDRLQLDQFIILGWSLGGILAIELALRMPDRVSGLILVATAARPQGSHPPVNWQDNLYTGIASVLNLLKPAWQWNIDMFGKRSLYRYLVQQHTTSVYQHLAKEGVSAYLQTSQLAHKALWNAQAQRTRYDRLPDLALIKCPALMLAGESDRHITAQSSRETAQHLHACEMRCYANTAHLFPWEISGKVLQDIDRWLEKVGLTEKL